MYRTAPQTRFAGGLNLVDGSDVVAPDQAMDAMNVTFLPAGGVRQRDGYQRLSTTELTNRPDSLAAHYESDGTRQLIVSNGNRLDVLNTSGTSIANEVTTAHPHSFIRFAAPGSEHTLIANGTDTIRRWDGAAFSTPVYTGTTPAGSFLAVTPMDNRLVVARTLANPDRVLFSGEGDPLTFGVNNYTDLHPGSGVPITAMVGWNDYVFVFKENEFFYYYGTGTSATGNPVFNFRRIAGAGSVGAACSSPEGVYFLDRRGVYRTTGGRADLVSSALDPIFLGGSSLFYLGGEANTSALAAARLWWSQGRLYLAFASGTSATNDRLAVYSPLDGWWTLYDIAVGAMTSFRPATREELMFAYASGLKHVGRYFEGSELAADDMTTGGTGGSAITSRWRQGWVDYGTQESKTIRQTKLWGAGTAQFGLAVDFAINPLRWDTITLSAANDLWGDGTGTDLWGDGAGTDLWGPSGTTRPWLMSMAAPGTNHSLMIRSAGSTWAIHRLAHGIRESRGPEVVGSGRTA
jgi:hypothetical protein